MVGFHRRPTRGPSYRSRERCSRIERLAFSEYVFTNVLADTIERFFSLGFPRKAVPNTSPRRLFSKRSTWIAEQAFILFSRLFAFPTKSCRINPFFRFSFFSSAKGRVQGVRVALLDFFHGFVENDRPPLFPDFGLWKRRAHTAF